MMWNETVNANWIRDRRSAVTSMTGPSLAPEIGSREIDKLVCFPVHHRFHHVEGKAFRHFDGNGGRHGELGSAYDRVDQYRPLMRQGRGHSHLHVARAFDPNSPNTNGLRHCGEIGVLELGAEVEEAGRF